MIHLHNEIFHVSASVDVTNDYHLLKDLGVTHILNVASTVTTENIREQFRYKHVPIADLVDVDITVYFDECFAFIDSARNAGGCVLVHCMAGVSRSASIVIAYVMKKGDVDFQEAFDSVKQQRPSIRPNDGFMEQLKSFNPRCFVRFK